MSKDKLEILDFNEETNECLDCGHESTSFGELYDEQGNKITSWNEDDEQLEGVKENGVSLPRSLHFSSCS